MRASVASLLVVAALAPQSAQAQESRLDELGLPRSEVSRLRAWVEDPGTRHYRTETHIGAGEVVRGSIVVWESGATIAGRVDGNVLIVDGDAQLEPGAYIAGDLTVVGGRIYGTEDAVLAGGVTEFAEGFGLAARAERAWVGREADRDWSWTDEHWRAGWGDSDFAVRIGENYNRVEGLPVLFGPEIRTGGSAPTRLDAYAIWRTEVGSPFDGDGFGYLARVEQWFDRDGWFRIGGTARSVVEPIERSHVSDLEASLASFVLHDDLRDYYERTGWSAYARFSPARFPFDLTVEYRDEDHATTPVRTPWTLFDREDRWRAQPLAAEGSIRLLGATAELDLRRSRDFSTHGWRFEAELLRSLEADLTLPHASPDAAPAIDPFVESFTVASVDLRRYQRAGRNSTLGLRLVGAGTLDEQPLPPQFQHALGGAGSLPGYAAFDIDCGARNLVVFRTGDDSAQEFYPSYGCDRYAMFQAEYRGGFDLRFGGHDDDDHGWNWNWDLGDPAWIVFFDAARGWAYDRDPTAGSFDTGTLYDAGLGILLGDLGIYGAMPLGDDAREVRLFVRLGPRF